MGDCALGIFDFTSFDSRGKIGVVVEDILKGFLSVRRTAKLINI